MAKNQTLSILTARDSHGIPTGYTDGYGKAADIAVNILSGRMIDADKLIKRLQGRIDEYIKKYPDKKDGVAVESIRELIHIIRLEVEE